MITMEDKVIKSYAQVYGHRGLGVHNLCSRHGEDKR